MSFVNPQLFWILILPLILFAFFVVRHKDNVSNLFSKEVLKRLSVGDDALPLVARNVMMFIALLLMLIALARPVKERGSHVVDLEGLLAVVALDISGSMRAKDIYPNRLEFAKKKMVTLLKEMPNDELALVAFAHTSFMLAPFSSDTITLQQIIEGVSDKYINMNSTNFTFLGEYVSELLNKRRDKILILFSDGGEKKDLEAFAQIIKKEKIALYVVLVGTKKGAPVIDKKGKRVTKNGTIVITQRNDELGQIALQSGGAFVVASTGAEEIKALVKIIKEQHRSKKQGEITIHDREEYFYYPLGLALFILLMSFASIPRRKKRKVEYES